MLNFDEISAPQIEVLTEAESKALEGASQEEVMAYLHRPEIMVRIYAALAEAFKPAED